MNTNPDRNKEALRWNRTAWLRVFLWTAAIFATVPVARRVQRYVYDTIGKDFFTYMVLFIFMSLLVALVYFLLFRSAVKSAHQYTWLALSAGAYIYTTLQLREHPEEAVHLLQFGFLAYLLYRALSHRIRDWTVYITTLLFVLFIGILDEFIQWLTPERIWSYKDIGINAVAGVYFVLAVSKGIKPETVRGPVKRFSVSMLAGIITLNLLFLGLCLSNTPEAVKQYTSVFPGLSWLAEEETMTEFLKEDSAVKGQADSPASSEKMITLFSLHTAWYTIIALIVSVWVCSEFWKRRLKEG